MMKILEIALGVSAIYSAAAYAWLVAQSIAHRVDYERETFHLGLCFILAVGFLGLLVK